MQGLILEAWAKSAMCKADLAKAVPNVTPSKLNKYVDGNTNVYFLERNAEAVLAALRAGPQGPKQSAMQRSL